MPVGARWSIDTSAAEPDDAVSGELRFNDAGGACTAFAAV
jgi:hypothetical protein